jgi:hypothetical protein
MLQREKEERGEEEEREEKGGGGSGFISSPKSIFINVNSVSSLKSVLIDV